MEQRASGESMEDVRGCAARLTAGGRDCSALGAPASEPGRAPELSYGSVQPSAGMEYKTFKSTLNPDNRADSLRRAVANLGLGKEFDDYFITNTKGQTK